MTLTVDYVPLANGGSANVVTQASYLALIAGALNNGYPADYILPSNVLNKSIRQSSMVSAALANFIANRLNTNILDDGNLTTLTTNLTSAILGGISSTQTVTGTNHTFAAADSALMTLRSNTGTLMVDTLPGTGTAVLPQGWKGTLVNNDSSALYQIIVGSGASLNGSSTGNIILGPGQRCIIFSDGANYWAQEMPGRVRLGAATGIYVATSGSDTANNGLASGSPFLTLQKAINFIYSNFDFNGQTLTLNVADGTYTTGLAISGNFTGLGTLVINGNTTTPSNCIISATSATCISISNSNCPINIQGFKLTTTTSGNTLNLGQSMGVVLSGNTNFGAVGSGSAHINVNEAILTIATNYTISGSAFAHWYFAYAGKIVCVVGSFTITLSGTPAWSTAFAVLGDLADLAIASGSLTFTGGSTGSRYSVTTNSVANTQGQGASYLPGNSVGSTATGGQYI